jgi:hypothetical protein
MPNIASNIENAQMAGHPSTLTYGGPGMNSVNRPIATEGIPRVPGLSIDEYPFACTNEGGAGAWIGHVPPGEQFIQGGVISDFLQRNGLQAGDAFTVIIGR